MAIGLTMATSLFVERNSAALVSAMVWSTVHDCLKNEIDIHNDKYKDNGGTKRNCSHYRNDFNERISECRPNDQRRRSEEELPL